MSEDLIAKQEAVAIAMSDALLLALRVKDFQIIRDMATANALTIDKLMTLKREHAPMELGSVTQPDGSTVTYVRQRIP